jgi:hypothetical protein
MSEGGEKPKSVNRITNIRQSHLCLREEKNKRALSILFMLFGFSPPSDIGGFV